MTREIVAWGPTVVWFAVLFFLSSLSQVPSLWSVPFADKAAHGILYCVLGVTLAWARSRTRVAVSVPAILLLGVAYGASDELHQRFVIGRVPSAWDLLADAVGVTLGVVLTCLVLARETRPIEYSESDA